MRRFLEPLMKKILGTTSLLFIGFISLAQEIANRSKLEISLGASIPISTYRNGAVDRHIKGFANTGQALSVSYYHPSKTKVGFMGMLSVIRNPINTGSIENKFSTSPFYSFSPSSGPPLPVNPKYYDNWSFNKESWYTFGILLGGYSKIALAAHSKLSLHAKAAIGVAYVLSPEYNGITESDTAIVAVLQKNDHAFGCSFILSPGLQYAINPRSMLTFNVSYFGTLEMNFKNVETGGTSMEQRPGPSGPSTVHSSWKFTSDVQQSVQTLNFSLGIQFELQ